MTCLVLEKYTAHSLSRTGIYSVLNLLLLLITLLALPVHALNTGLPADAMLGTQLQEWRETEPLEHISDILRDERDWRQVSAEVPNPGVGQNVTWYRLRVTASANEPDWVAVISYPMIERLDLLLVRDGNILSHQASGNTITPRSDTLRPKLQFEFPLAFAGEGDYELYFRAENRGLLNFPLCIRTQEQLASDNQSRQLGFGVYIGFLAAVFLYNLAVFVVIRERYMIYFCGFVGSYILFFLAHSGLGYSYVWNMSGYFEQRASIVFGALPMLFTVLFSASFLPASRRYRRFGYQLKHAAIFIAATALALTFLPDYQIALDTMRFSTVAVPLLLILMASVAGPMHSPSVLVYSIGIYALAISIIIHSLTRQGFIPTTAITQYATHIGAGSMIAIHSLAIVLRLYEQRLEQIRTRQAIIRARKESRKSEERLRESEQHLHRTAEEARAKSAFLAMMSHEIRTPLNGVLGMVELLQHTRLDTQQRRYIETISSSGETLLSLLNDILDLSKIESGKMTVERREVALAPLINDAIILYSRQAAEKHLTLIADLQPPYYHFIHTDEIRLRQILNNLLNNAVKFTSQGQVILRVEWREDSLILQVEDSGIGIQLSQQEKLFQSFSQAEDSTQRQYGGTGLGLTICQKLVELLDGEIDVRSKPGAGSVFTVTLRHVEPGGLQNYPDLSGRSFYAELSDPYEKEFVIRTLIHQGMKEAPGHFANPDCVITDVPPMAGESSANSLYLVNSFWPRISSDRQIERPLRSHILVHQLCNLLDLRNTDGVPNNDNFRTGVIWVAEDNLVNQKVIAGMLKHMGMDFMIFDNGAQVLKEYGMNPDLPDLILMDCEMPVMDGYEATRQIRRLQKDQNLAPIPVIALTAHLGGEFEQYAREAGMDELINKPVRKQSLKRLFQVWLPKEETQR